MQRDMERYQQRAAAAPRKPATPEKVRHRSVATGLLQAGDCDSAVLVSLSSALGRSNRPTVSSARDMKMLEGC